MLKFILPLLLLGGATWTYSYFSSPRPVTYNAERGCIESIKPDSDGKTLPVDTCDRKL